MCAPDRGDVDLLHRQHPKLLDLYDGSTSSDYHSAFGTRIVIEAEGAARSTVEILAQHGISVDRSADLV